MTAELQFLGSGDAFGSGGRLQTCLRLSGGGADVLLDCGATSLVAMKRARVDPGAIEWVVLTHLHGDHYGCGAPPYAIRADYGGKVVTYSGDTEWTDTLVEAADGADLFVCEAYFFDKKTKYHLDCTTLMGHRDHLRCQRLVLTHMSQDMLDRRAEAKAETAEEMQVLAL